MKNVKLLIALLVIAGAAYWAYDATYTRMFDGRKLEFTVGNGSTIVLTHNADDPLPVAFTSGSTFSMTADVSNLAGTASREGSGRRASYHFEREIPAGTTELRVARGSGITVSIDAESPVEAIITPLNPSDARNTVIFAGVVVLAALFYISRLFQHRWFALIVRKVARNGRPLPTQSPLRKAGG